MSRERGFDWGMLNGKAQNVLGNEFWSEINKVLPKHGPNIDVYRTDKEFLVVLEVPGISSAEEINIRIKGYKMIISGKIPWQYPVDEEELLQKERFIGEFNREISLPNDIDLSGKIEARYKNGIIQIAIPLNYIEDEKEIQVGFE